MKSFTKMKKVKIKKSIEFSNFHILVLILIILFCFLFFVFLNSNENYPNKNSNNTNFNMINYSSMEKSFIKGNSMNPTLKNEEVVYLDRNYTSYKRGDIVAFKLKSNDEYFVKRIIAVGDDSIIFGKDGFIYVNGKKLNESYLSGLSFVKDERLKLLLKQLEYYNNVIPKGYVLLLGDNRVNSYDSSEYGVIPIEYLVGKVYK